MKINCDKQTLSESISNVMKAVSSKTTLPILEGILLEAKNDKLTLIGYDLEMGITTKIPAIIEKEGSIVLTASHLYNIIRKMPGDSISIETDIKNKTTIKSGIAIFDILGMNSVDYPSIPEITSSNSFKIKNNILKEMIDTTLFAVAQTDTRPIQTGSLFEVSKDEIRLISVDGFRLALRKEKIEYENNMEEDFSFVVPGKTLLEISKLVESHDEDETVEIRFTGKHGLFLINNYTIFTRLLEGQFLDYRNSIPKTETTKILLDTRSLIQSVERTSLLITERLKSPLRCTFEDNKVKLSCITSLGKAYDEVEADIEGESVDIGFNNRYLIDALRNCSDDEIILKMGGSLSPMVIIPKEGDRYLYLVLPMRLPNE